MFEQVLAGVVAAVCLAMLARLLLGARHRYALDAWLRRCGLAIRRRALLFYRWRSSSREAQRQAHEAINRARRGGGTWEGNVYRPKSFRGPRKPSDSADTTDTKPH